MFAKLFYIFVASACFLSWLPQTECYYLNGAMYGRHSRDPNFKTGMDHLIKTINDFFYTGYSADYGMGTIQYV